MAQRSWEQKLYGKIIDSEMSGLDKFPVESFCPCRGHILAILPPKLEKIKGILIPESSQEDQCVAKVAAVPQIPLMHVLDVNQETRKVGAEAREGNDPSCPVSPGDWVVFVPGGFRSVKFGGREDLILLNYSVDGDPQAEILGFIPEEEAEEALGRVDSEKEEGQDLKEEEKVPEVVTEP